MQLSLSVVGIAHTQRQGQAASRDLAGSNRAVNKINFLLAVLRATKRWQVVSGSTLVLKVPGTSCILAL